MTPAHRQQVRDLITTELGPAEPITPSTHLREDLGADSLDLVELLLAVEQTFGLDLPDDIVDDWQTVDAMEQSLAPYLGG